MKYTGILQTQPSHENNCRTEHQCLMAQILFFPTVHEVLSVLFSALSTGLSHTWVEESRGGEKSFSINTDRERTSAQWGVVARIWQVALELLFFSCTSARIHTQLQQDGKVPKVPEGGLLRWDLGFYSFFFFFFVCTFTSTFISFAHVCQHFLVGEKK